MPDPIADYEKAADGFAAVLARCGDLDAPSPCEDWKARDVLEHVVTGIGAFAVTLGGEAPAADTEDASARFAAARAALVDAARRPGALDVMVPAPIGGELPAAVLLGILTSDTLIHTWDLARATGQEVELDRGLLERSWEGLKPMDEVVRRPGVFGPKVEVSEDAPFQDRALAFFGRRP